MTDERKVTYNIEKEVVISLRNFTWYGALFTLGILLGFYEDQHEVVANMISAPMSFWEGLGSALIYIVTWPFFLGYIFGRIARFATI